MEFFHARQDIDKHHILYSCLFAKKNYFKNVNGVFFVVHQKETAEQPRPPTTKVGRNRSTFKGIIRVRETYLFWRYFREPCWNSLKYQILSVNPQMSQCLSWTLSYMYNIIYTFVIGLSLVCRVCSWSFFGKHIFQQVSRHVGLKDLGGPLYCLKNGAQTSLTKAARASKMSPLKCSWCWVVSLKLTSAIKNVPATFIVGEDPAFETSKALSQLDSYSL